MRSIAAHITIRVAEVADGPALSALAQLDSATPLGEPVLIAEVDGEVRAALSVPDDRAIGDPFFPTRHLVDLLRVHATQLQVGEGRANGNGWRRWLPRAPSPAPARAS